MNSNIVFSDKDYPGLYQAADSESIDSQKKYFRVLWWFLFLLVFGSIFSLLSDQSKLSSFISAILFICSLFLSMYVAFRRLDRSWYSARAVAESVKTLTWRYMMRSEPYAEYVSESDVRSAFLSDLKAILNQNREITRELCNENASADAISITMNTVRSRDMGERIVFYRKYRLEEQRDWYQRKARLNKQDTKKWFVYIATLNGFAIICSIIKIAYTNFTLLPTGVFAVAAASAVTWLQAKRFSELWTSYALAEHEINIIHAKIQNITSEYYLSRYVSDTENAFSREHTQWVARRDSTFNR